jgi:integrative and conjugative element protein (TIGR02256 family)
VGAPSPESAGLPDLLLNVTYEVEIRPDAAARIVEMSSASADGNETGGILLGRGPDAAGLVIVERAGDPGPKADRRPDYFLRDLAHARTLAAAAWEQDKAIWVGEWHTHVHGDPRPSPTDLATYAGHLAAAELEFEVFVSIIAVPDQERGWEDPLLAPWLLEISEIPVEAARRAG